MHGENFPFSKNTLLAKLHSFANHYEQHYSYPDPGFVQKQNKKKKVNNPTHFRLLKYGCLSCEFVCVCVCVCLQLRQAGKVAGLKPSRQARKAG